MFIFLVSWPETLCIWKVPFETMLPATLWNIVLYYHMLSETFLIHFIHGRYVMSNLDYRYFSVTVVSTLFQTLLQINEIIVDVCSALLHLNIYLYS